MLPRVMLALPYNGQSPDGYTGKAAKECEPGCHSQYHKQCTQPQIILPSEVHSLWLFHSLLPVSRFTSGLELVPVMSGARGTVPSLCWTCLQLLSLASGSLSL